MRSKHCISKVVLFFCLEKTGYQEQVHSRISSGACVDTSLQPWVKHLEALIKGPVHTGIFLLNSFEQCCFGVVCCSMCRGLWPGIWDAPYIESFHAKLHSRYEKNLFQAPNIQTFSAFQLHFCPLFFFSPKCLRKSNPSFFVYLQILSLFYNKK